MTWQDSLAAMLSERIGFDPASVGPDHVKRAAETRMSRTNLAEPSAFLRLLQTDPTEWNAFLEEVVVPESWFFRDQLPFERLARFAREEWQSSAPPAAPLRVLSIPCACGEEAYSAAVTLLQAGIAPERIRIRAMDISQRALRRAQAGHFGSFSFRGQSMQAAASYLTFEGESCRINPAVRDLVRFEQGNLIDSELLHDVEPFDVVFCRNLFIYLTESARRMALANLIRLLAPNGLLFMGHAENYAMLAERFATDGDAGCFAYRRKELEAVLALRPRDAVQSSPSPRPAPLLGKAPKTAPAPQTKAAVVPEPATTPRRMKFVPAEKRPYLREAEALADQRQYAEARILCAKALEQSGPDPQVFYLLGLIALAEDALDEAERNLVKCVYLDETHREALLHLSELASRRGEWERGNRYRDRARRARHAEEKS